ncbi:MAG: MFS transporter, partial [Candidatus Lokiarchaeota archaeon]|nr:MFS transporter [Candidatus Lokiarchaeota archaeon]
SPDIRKDNIASLPVSLKFNKSSKTYFHSFFKFSFLFILVIIFLPESLTKKESKVEFKFGDILPIKETKRFFKSAEIRGVLITFFIYSFGFFLFITTFSLFARDQVHATPQEITFYMAWIGVLRVLFQSVLINPILKKVSENITLKLGIFAMIFTFVFLIFSTNFWIVFIPVSFLAFGTGLVRPILTSKLTKSVKREETGSILGVNNALSSVAQIVTPILGGLILEFLPTQILPIISAIIFTLIIILWRWLIVRSVKEEN